jgi:hypothetical protein
MFSRIILILLLAVVAQARGATETERALVIGSVILNGECGPEVANVQITDYAHTDAPWATGGDGGFTLDYPHRAWREGAARSDQGRVCRCQLGLT